MVSKNDFECVDDTFYQWHKLSFAMKFGCRIAPSDMPTTDENVRDGFLAGQGEESILNCCAIRKTVQFNDVGFHSEIVKQRFNLLAIWASSLAEYHNGKRSVADELPDLERGGNQ